MTRNRITRLAATFTSVFAVWLIAMPLTAQARPGTIGSSNEAAGETPQITEFQVSPANPQAGSHSTTNIWMRFCSPNYDIDPDPAPPVTDFGARKIIGATNTTPIRVTTQNPHTIFTGDTITIERVEGNTAANSEGAVVTVPTVDDPGTPLDERTHSFDINGSVGNAD
jgi:hypothetical protein